MQSQRDFFYTVLSGEGKPCLAWLVPAEPKAYFKHRVFDTIEEFCEALSGTDFTKFNYYFGISTLDKPAIDVGGKKRVRTQQNARNTRCFVLDIDVRDDKPGFYTTKEDAWAGIQKIQEALSLPAPIVVDSGFGYHVYWPMAEGIPSADWVKSARRFKKVVDLIAPQCTADSTRVADSAGVLRVPGSFNLKAGKLTPVSIVQWTTGVIDFAKFDMHLKMLTGEVGTTAVKKVNIEATVVDSGPTDLAATAKNCNWVKQYLINKSTASEPEWYAMLGLVPFLTYKTPTKEISGPELAKAMSKGHEQYNEEATLSKYNQVRIAQSGPTTCQKLESLNPERCKGCPFRTTVKTPLGTARLARPIDTPTVVNTVTHTDKGEQIEETITIPVPPSPYFRGEGGGVFIRVKQQQEDGSWDESIEKIYDYDIYPTRRFRNEAHENELMETHLWLPKDGLRKFKVPTGLLADNKKLAQHLAEKGVVTEFGKTIRVAKFLTDYVRHLQMTAAAEVEFARFGWRDALSADPKFIVGNGFLNRSGNLQPGTFAPYLRDASKATQAKGSLEQWKEGFNTYLSIPNTEAYQIACLLAFAAPLMALTEYSGVLYNMVGDSAAGKSTALKMMTSVFGEPNPQHVLVTDTEISMFNFIGYLNNIPVAFDELTKMDPDKLSNFTLNFTGGRGKMRANRNGENKDNHVEWDTIVAGSSNTSLYDKLAANRRGYNAEAMRVFEVNVRASDPRYKPMIDVALARIRDNYGHAGREYVKYLIPRTIQIRDLIDKTIPMIVQQGKLRNEERFWGALLACVMVGGLIARDKLNLHNYDVQGLVNWALGVSKEVREVVVNITSDPVSVLSEFLNNNLNGIIRINDNLVDLAADATKIQKIVVRMEYLDRKPDVAYISTAAVREYCNLRKTDPSWLRKELADMGILVSDNKPKRLASGTNLPNVPVKVWQIDLKHPRLQDLIEGLSEIGVDNGDSQTS